MGLCNCCVTENSLASTLSNQLDLSRKRLGGILGRYDDDDDDVRVMTLDDLLGPVPENIEQNLPTHYYADDYSNTTSPQVSDKNLSKSQRVRLFMEENPDARNRDVVTALAEYGVTAADVSNAKAHLKRKGDVPAKRGRPAASASEATPPVAKAAPADSSQTATGSIAMNELDAAVTFVRQIGSLERAKQLLVIIQQIQTL